MLDHRKCWGVWGGGQAQVWVGAGCCSLALGPCSSAPDLPVHSDPSPCLRLGSLNPARHGDALPSRCPAAGGPWLRSLHRH